VVAFVASMIMLIAGVGVCLLVARSRPVGKPLTWGEAMVAAMFVFGLLVLAYGVVPNMWLLWADNELSWRKDAFAYVVRFWGRGQIQITKQALRDLIVVAIYGVMLGAHVFLWSAWQKRGRRGDAPAPAAVSSSYGRPVLRKG